MTYDMMDTLKGLMSCNPKTERGMSRDEFGINKNARKRNLEKYGVRKYSERKNK